MDRSRPPRQASSAPSPPPLPAPPASLTTVAVVGLGTMGTGIAELLARAGLEVVGVDPDPAAVQRAVATLESATARCVERGRLTRRQRGELLARFRTFADLPAVAQADLVVEVVPEDWAAKRAVLRELDGIVRPDAIVATGTSALSVTHLAAETAHPQRLVGLHFFHPAPVMRLVEVVSSVLTEETVVRTVTELVRSLGREPLPVGDRPGFLAGGLLFGYLNQAAAMYESRYASREDIDAAMRLGCGLPMGPLELLDLVGVDTARTVLETLYAATGDRLHAPAPILGQLSAAGLTGRKAGRGFYRYPVSDAGLPNGDTVPETDPGASGGQGGPGNPGEPGAAVGRPVTGPAGPGLAVGSVGADAVGVDTVDVEAVGVAGSGTMATGIAEVFLRADYPVVLVARSTPKAEAARERVAASLRRAVRRGRLTEEARSAALSRLRVADTPGALSGVDLVVEAIAEDLDAKRRLFAELDRVCAPGAVLATTTSSLPVIACARATGRPRDVVGMHFFNPAPAMRLVEVVHTVLTAEETLTRVHRVCERLGKHPVRCGDRAGFIVNALLFPYLNNAVKLVQEHYASPDDVDAAMRLGGGYPMGPFELLDVVGLDVSLTIEEVLHREFREPGLAPAPLLARLVAAGCLGRKSGRGFREHASR